MDLSKISTGPKPPFDIYGVIEIPQGGAPVKYEMDKDSGVLFVDRFRHTAMYYPANYGFIPHTLAEDGDPVDVLVLAQVAVVPGAVIRCRPVGAIIMADEKGPDEKIIAVPVDRLNPFYKGVRTYRDLPTALVEQLGHFFKHYKDLDDKRWSRVSKWVGVKEAGKLVMAGIERAARRR